MVTRSTLLRVILSGNRNMKKIIASFLSVSIVLFGLLTSAPRFGASAEVITLFDATLSASKTEVAPGETFTYTFDIKNVTGDTTVSPLFVVPTLSPLVTYAPGSGKAFKGTASADVSDSWLTDGLNLGDLGPGQSAKVTFQAKVVSVAGSGAALESVIQINKTWLPAGKNEWFQTASKITVKKQGQVLGAETLPETGPSEVLLISGYLGYLGFLLRRLKLTKYW